MVLSAGPGSVVIYIVIVTEVFDDSNRKSSVSALSF